MTTQVRTPLEVRAAAGLAPAPTPRPWKTGTPPSEVSPVDVAARVAPRPPVTLGDVVATVDAAARYEAERARAAAEADRAHLVLQKADRAAREASARVHDLTRRAIDQGGIQ